MQILIACAKTMTGTAPRTLKLNTEPIFQQRAWDNAVQLSELKAEELKSLLNVNGTIASETHRRYQSFFDNNERQPAVFAYDGMVFKKLAPETFSDEELEYANNHLLIGSFLYGILRPLDLINKYRMEGNIVLPQNGGKNMFQYWKPVLTDWFIDRIKSDDGILVNLASAEFKRLFDWKRVIRDVKVITPEFFVMKRGVPKTVVVYAKMCRGAMTRWILKNQITNPDNLTNFEYEGFQYVEEAGYWLLK